MPRFTTLAALALFLLATALMTGCDSGGKGSSLNATKPPPESGSTKPLEPAKVVEPK